MRLKKLIQSVLPHHGQATQAEPPRAAPPAHAQEQPLRTVYDSPPSYSGDSLRTWNKSVDFLKDPRFIEAYELGMDSGHIIGRPNGGNADLHIEWRIHTCLWAATHAVKLPGDFVECGTNTGIMSLAICKYLDFNTTGKTFWLFDTFEGAPLDQMIEDEWEAGRDKTKNQYFPCYELTKNNFHPYTNVKLVKGIVPDTFSQVDIDAVSYLCVDMNIVYPEVAALEFFWPKLVTGAVVVLDDYGWKQCAIQKRGHDAFARKVGVEIMLLPTGQGLILKP